MHDYQTNKLSTTLLPSNIVHVVMTIFDSNKDVLYCAIRSSKSSNIEAIV